VPNFNAFNLEKFVFIVKVLFFWLLFQKVYKNIFFQDDQAEQLLSPAAAAEALKRERSLAFLDSLISRTEQERLRAVHARQLSQAQANAQVLQISPG
jgi:hypothetical protein